MNAIRSFILASLIPVLAFTLNSCAANNPADLSIPSSGGETFSHTNFPAAPYYLQIDPRWKDIPIGGCNMPIGQVGCTLCCVSMAFTQLGFPIEPGILNSKLISGHGYTRNGLLDWDAATAISGKLITFDIPRGPTHAKIDAALRAGNPILAKIHLRDIVTHWVLIVGKDGQDYLAKDPLNEQRTIQKVSALSSRIQAIRIACRKTK